MADIALVFHWPPDQLAALDLADLATWHARAVSRFDLIRPRG